jgi:hypothetical protein
MVVIVVVTMFAAMAAFVPGGLAAMRQNMDAGAMAPTPRYMAINLASGFVAALIGGLITARIAPRSPNGHLAALAAVVLAMGVVSAFMPGADRQPSWYKLVIPIMGVAGIAASALFVSGRAAAG